MAFLVTLFVPRKLSIFQSTFDIHDFKLIFFPSFINEAVLQITVFQLAVIYEAEAKISVSCKMHIKNQLGVCGSCGYRLGCSPKKFGIFCVCSNVVNINSTKKLLETVE